jgi:hypothetical protein
VKFDGTFSNTALDIAVSKPQFVRAAYSNDGTQALSTIAGGETISAQ